MSEKSGDSVIKIADETSTNDELIINEWINARHAWQQSSTTVTQRIRRIHKVCETLRLNEHNKKEYDPVVVSFGPYNHGRKDLQSAEDFKRTSLRIYTSYCDGKSIEDLLKKVLEVINVVRGFYIEGSTNEYKDDEFAEMMLLDGCLVLNLIQWVSTDDSKWLLVYEHLGPSRFPYLVRDMFLVENQLPYQVLQVLMSTRFDKEEDQTNTILDNLELFFYRVFAHEFPHGEGLKATTISQYEKQPPLHLLEILRTFFLSKFGVSDSFKKPESHDHKFDPHSINPSFRSVTEIKAKGILCRPCNGNSETDNINFKSNYLYGKLEIPPIVIMKHTMTTLLNLIAYEMCPNNPNDMRVTMYIGFLKKLIQHPDDVKELRTNNILLYSTGTDDELVAMFKDIITPAVNPLVFNRVQGQIQRHYDSKARTWIAELVAKYFSSPWKAIAMLAAVAVLVLAILQTQFTIHPTKK